jgi:tRNA (guanine-N7-)-methyltransferase
VRKGPRLPAEELRPYTIETPPTWRGAPDDQDKPAAAPELLDWRTVFGNDRPVEIEVGSGKGLFLVTAGQANPEANYLGIEIVRKYQLYTASRAAKRKLTNVKTVCTDARFFLRDRVADASVQAIHVYFPDPWWKTRHHKRRVFTSEFARQCLRILKPGGRLLVATDVAEYATMVRETVAGIAGLVESAAPAEHEPAHDMDYLTNFERKFRHEGRPIYRMGFSKS